MAFDIGFPGVTLGLCVLFLFVLFMKPLIVLGVNTATLHDWRCYVGAVLIHCCLISGSILQCFALVKARS